MKSAYFMIALLTLQGCATVNVPNMGEKGYSVEDDERRMFKRSQEATEILDDSDYVIDDPRLEQYLTGLLSKLMPDEMKSEDVIPSVRVLREPSFNAFALPNGRIYVHLGILAAAENEAQIASLLGHEITHILHRHALKQFRSAINKSAFFSTLALGTAGVGYGGVGGLIFQLGLYGSLSGYSKNLEYEADATGFKLLIDNKYDVREASKFFESLESFLKDEKVKTPFFFSTHPAVKARISNFGKLIAKNKFEGGPGFTVNTEQFESFIDGVMLEQVVLCLPEGYFKTALKTVNRYIERNPGDKTGYYYLGEIFRQRQDPEKKEKQRDKTGDYSQAAEAYDKALALDADYAGALKAKARVQLSRGETAEAVALYKKYLAVDPSAEDRGYIENIIKKYQ